jgi:hypothetical protein
MLSPPVRVPPCPVLVRRRDHHCCLALALTSMRLVCCSLWRRVWLQVDDGDQQESRETAAGACKPADSALGWGFAGLARAACAHNRGSCTAARSLSPVLAAVVDCLPPGRW